MARYGGGLDEFLWNTNANKGDLMSEVTNFTNPLSGHEVVEDILGQIRKRLYSDCSLRGEDGYSGGYFGSVAIKLKCNAVRTASIEMEFPITHPAVVKAQGPTAC